MRFRDGLRIAFRALGAHTLRSVLTALGIVIGIGAVITLVAVAEGVRRNVTGVLQRAGSNVVMVRPGQLTFVGTSVTLAGQETTTLRMEDAEALRKRATTVKAVVPIQRDRMVVDYRGKSLSTDVFGSTPGITIVKAFELSRGRFFDEEEVQGRAKVAVLGKLVAEELFEGEDPVGKTLRIKGIDFEVVGALKEKGATSARWLNWDDAVYTPITTYVSRVVNVDYLDAIYLQAKGREIVRDAEEEIKTILRQQHQIVPPRQDDFTVKSFPELLEAANQAAGKLTLFLGSIAAISMLVGGIGVMNIMLVSVTERTREIGLRKAVGAKRRDILLQFLLEAVVICLIGGSLGISLGAALTRLLARSGGIPAATSLGSILVAVAFTVAVGLFFGIYPAKKASGLQPVEALRHGR